MRVQHEGDKLSIPNFTWEVNFFLLHFLFLYLSFCICLEFLFGFFF